MNNCFKLFIQREQARIAKLKINKKTKTETDAITLTQPEIEMEVIFGKNVLCLISMTDLQNYFNKTVEPFPTTNLNVRSAFQLRKHCSICGCSNGKENPIESYHIRHIRKGNRSGFSKIRKVLNRKTTPCCRKYHQKIHKEIYEGMALREFLTQ